MTASILERLRTALAGRYDVERELGAGGMATVYLAEDLRHKRKVALKVLRPDLAAVLGAERFVQEITTTASLQHPHILPLFDSGTADGFLFYVMPFIEGETLRGKLNRETQLGIEEAIAIAASIADALDYAHRHGVIHRDIKPENILLHDGRPVVADFGIALAVSAAAGGRMTETGLSLGTPHYMSPEQATAEKELTNRSDIYSLASVLYEMLTGSPPHVGSSAQQIIMKIVTDEARPVTELRKSVPPYVGAAVAKALEKLPADRFATAHEFAEALHGRGATATSTVALPGVRGSRPAQASWRGRLRDPVTLAAAVVAVASLVFALGFRRSAPAEPSAPIPVQFVLTTPDSAKPHDNVPWPAAISPDGGTLVYTVVKGSLLTVLYALRTDQLEPREIPGTADAGQPYFSPDGQWLAFETGDGKEHKVRLDGSAPITITAASGDNGADWTAANDIVLGSQGNYRGLSHVSAAGGVTTALTVPDTTHGERDHIWPIATPDGAAIVFVVWRGALQSSELAITSSAGGKATPLGIPGIRPLAVLDGRLVYVQADGAVMAVPLDVAGRKVRGAPVPVHDRVTVVPNYNGNSGVFVSRGGAMVTSRGGSLAKLAWLMPGGRVQPILPEARPLYYARLSPDERHIAVVVGDGQKRDVWIYDVELGTFSRLTNMGTITSVEWTADGSRLVYAASEKQPGVWSQAPTGGTQPQKIYESPSPAVMAAVAPDQRSLLLNAIPGNYWEVERVVLDSGKTHQTFVATVGAVGAPQFAPGGRWVALASTESEGSSEIYVRSYPDPSSRIQISVGGGFEPVWSPDGRRLFYRSGQRLMAARVALEPEFRLLGRDTVTTGMPGPGSFFSGSYDVARDGKRILAIVPDRDEFQLVVSPFWITELRRRLAEAGGGAAAKP